MDINALVAQAKSAVDTLEDQTEVRSGGDFEYEAPAAGYTTARFIGYVELGRRKQAPYLGQQKPDADVVRLDFELNGQKHIREIDVGGVKKQVTNRVSIMLTKKLNDRASFTKLFKKMTYGRDGIKHMVQMLDEPFIIQIVHNTKEKDGKKRTYANMRDADGNFLIQAPVLLDPLAGTSTPVPVPATTQPHRVLLWDAPTKEQWDSLFIDGTRTVKDDKGQEREVSKNWLQEEIVQLAVNFDGSPLQMLLSGVGNLDLSPEPSAPAAPSQTPASPQPAPAGATTATTPAQPPAAPPAAAGGADDLMASLGLN